MIRAAILPAIIFLAYMLTGCVVMTRRHFEFMKHGERSLGHLEGLDACGEILKRNEQIFLTPGLRRSEFNDSTMDEIATQAAIETDRKLKSEIDRLLRGEVYR